MNNSMMLPAEALPQAERSRPTSAATPSIEAIVACPIQDSCQVNWLPVLMYHRVVESVSRPDRYQVCISAAAFEAQIAYLHARGYRAITSEEVPAAVSGEARGERTVAITFDDGYMDVYTHAYPILKKYGFTATIMLVSDHIGGSNVWDRGVAESAPLVSLREIREMQSGGMQFGAHTATHPSLPDISLQRVRSELAGSKEKLEQLLGEEVRTLAYPYGRCTPAIRRIAMETGFVVAFGGQPRAHSLFDFSRINAAAHRGDTLLWRLNGAGVFHRLRHCRGAKALRHVRDRALDGWSRARQALDAAAS